MSAIDRKNSLCNVVHALMTMLVPPALGGDGMVVTVRRLSRGKTRVIGSWPDGSKVSAVVSVVFDRQRRRR